MNHVNFIVKKIAPILGTICLSLILLSLIHFISSKMDRSSYAWKPEITDKPHEVTIMVNANTIKGPFKNLAGGVNIWDHPRRVTESGKGLQNFLEKIGSNHFFQTRAFTGFVNPSLDNYFIIEGVDDSKNLKTAVDLIHSRGGKVMLQVMGVPRWLSTCDFANNQKCDQTIGPVPEYSKYPPKDYNTWRLLVAGLMNRLKLLDIKIDYFALYGEPNFGTTWWGEGGTKAIASFLEHYKQTAQAIRNVSPEAQIGGAAFGSIHVPLDLSSSSRHAKWIREFINFVNKNNIPLDFFTWHSYTPRTEMYRLDAKTIRNYLDDKGLKKVPILLTEWGVEGRGQFLRDKASTHFGASFATAALIEISHSTNDGQNYYTILDGNARFGLINHDHQPKSAFNAFRLFSMLEGDEIEAKTDEFPYKITLRTSEVEQEDIKVVATKGTEGIMLLATYYVPVVPEKDPQYDLSRRIKIIIKGISYKKYAYSLYLIDSKHSNNFFEENKELEIIEKGKGGGDFQKILTLPIYSTIMVKIEELDG